MPTLPTVDFFGKQVSRLICGGNPLGGFSHISDEVDREMIEYYTMPNIQKLLDDCWTQGINAFQSRGDCHQMRAFLEHRLAGGQMHWIAQTATENANLRRNIEEIASYNSLAIYQHGSQVDNSWHRGDIDQITPDILKAIHDQGLPAGVAAHNPKVIEYIEEKGWEADFYMCCFYNLARGYKAAPKTDRDAYANDRFPAEDPARMASVMRNVDKPCIAFKILAASRNCKTPESLRQAFQFAFDHIKPTDLVDVGMFPKYSDQPAENAAIVREILGEAAGELKGAAKEGGAQ